MDKDKIENLLKEYKNEKISKEDVLSFIEQMNYKDLGYAKIDNNRKKRNGYSEVIYCEGKTPSQIKGILQYMLDSGEFNILGTRANKDIYEAALEICENVAYHEDARIIIVNPKEIGKTKNKIAILTGGTTDLPVAEEAAITCEVFGNSVDRIYDVGVAGIHRLLGNLDRINEANVIITIAGMEGALTSVVAGLVDKPVIAVPTSVGYGTNLNGVTALLSMLNSCSSGVSVVNIDNGFGAAYLASMINKMNEER